MKTDTLTQMVIGSAIEVHKTLGPGLLESAYEGCLFYELLNRDIAVERQKLLPLNYKGTEIDSGYRLDILIPGQLIVEIKAVSKLLPIHTAQIITYLKLSKINTGLLINFNVEKLTMGLKRISI